MQLQNKVASKGRGILAMDESNATCGKRLDSIGVENTEDNRRAYRELLISTPGLGQYISGAILFEETLYQNTKAGVPMVKVMNDQGIVPGAWPSGLLGVARFFPGSVGPAFSAHLLRSRPAYGALNDVNCNGCFAPRLAPWVVPAGLPVSQPWNSSTGLVCSAALLTRYF